MMFLRYFSVTTSSLFCFLFFFFSKCSPKLGCILYTGLHYTPVNTVVPLVHKMTCYHQRNCHYSSQAAQPDIDNSRYAYFSKKCFFTNNNESNVYTSANLSMRVLLRSLLQVRTLDVTIMHVTLSKSKGGFPLLRFSPRMLT